MSDSIKVVKKDNVDKAAIALEALKRIREEQADMKRRFNGLMAAWDKKAKDIDDFIALHLKGH